MRLRSRFFAHRVALRSTRITDVTSVVTEMHFKNKNIDQQLQLTAAALHEQEEFVRLLLDSTAEAIFGIDQDGTFTFCNASCVHMLGYEVAEDLLHKNSHALLHHSREDGSRYDWNDCPVRRGFIRGEKVHITDEVMWRKDGTCFPAEYWSYPIRRNGDVIGAVVTFIDISERRLLEAQLRQIQKMDAIGTLAGGVAHDFNNLLMVIGAYSELMLDSLGTGHPLRRNVQQILTAAKRAAELTRQLLAFGRKQMQALQVLDLNPVVDAIGNMLPRLIGEDIQLITIEGDCLEKVKADPGQIEQILMNLAANARDAMPKGGKLTIETSNVHLDEAYQQNHVIVPSGDYVLLSVSDSGEGIAPNHMQHIFEPFYTTKADGRGTGLGLATVYGIVKQSGGFIWVYSEVGLGTTFKIYLPIVQGKAEPRPRVHEKANLVGTETVLLVEDEAAVRSSTKEFLSLNGYHVIEAKDGEEALSLSRDYSGDIDIVVTDVVLPKLGGAEVAERLTKERPLTKVLFVSGYAENTILRHGVIDVGARFLQKPFSLKSLTRKIREVLETKTSSAVGSA